MQSSKEWLQTLPNSILNPPTGRFPAATAGGCGSMWQDSVCLPLLRCAQKRFVCCWNVLWQTMRLDWIGGCVLYLYGKRRARLRFRMRVSMCVLRLYECVCVCCGCANAAMRECAIPCGVARFGASAQTHFKWMEVIRDIPTASRSACSHGTAALWRGNDGGCGGGLSACCTICTNMLFAALPR